ncbi:cupin domain-containing protein [Acidovorax sp. SUPP2522]|uniref:cupin domain-containing protein n=1 Tax=unclassified Acidovorax TaxID=2684926 RepID=UPI002348FFA4|nr:MULTISPECIES: cupin domain-containing protein [unclassified Acidovorax]WCM96742.1 cupin domain-containing protein [Acidovorax sp. GBBC 1281]GKT19981.1 cupin domain-containing protein [Acidovorax sp. SUPP2522]
MPKATTPSTATAPFTANVPSAPASHAAINLAHKFSLIDALWQPRVVAEMNGYQFKLARIDGEFIWHCHADTDEAFFVVQGRLRIELRDGDLELNAGEMFVVPRGTEHRPCALGEVWLMLVEPRGVLNTGDSGGERTAPNDRWV